jgi:hypothetical protein
MVDSGAYTQQTQGTAIDFDQYCRFLLKHRDWLGPDYFNLDEINDRYPNDAAAISFDRYQQMRAQGLAPVPVFHAGENQDWLRKYLDEGCHCIGLGGAAQLRSRNHDNRRFYDAAFNTISNHAGRPLRVHALGLSIADVLLQHPFTSTDSTSWVLRSQRFALTDLSRLGPPQWIQGLSTHERLAAATYLECRDSVRLEQEIRETRDEFNFHLVARLGNLWLLPGMRLVGARSALFSYAGALPQSAGILRQFIEQPDQVLAQDRYHRAMQLLLEMQQRYDEHHNSGREKSSH